MSQNIDLASIFQAVTQTLAEKQQELNQADTLNQDHGTNMVRTFQTITQALQEQKGNPDSVALGYAARQLSNTLNSGSGKLYAEGLAQAAGAFQGKDVDAGGAIDLLKYMIGGGQAQPQQTSNVGDVLGNLLGGMLGGGQGQTQQPQQTSGGGDMLGDLLGGMLGGGQTQPQQSQQTNSGGDLLGSLLGGMLGGGQTQPTQTTQQTQNDGLDVGDLVNAGMAYMQAKSRGGSNLEAIIQAFMAASGMGTSAHRTQSTQLVVGTFLKALSAFGGTK